MVYLRTDMSVYTALDRHTSEEGKRSFYRAELMVMGSSCRGKKREVAT